MILIDCPYCGPRGHEEFTYAGDATKRRPEIGGAPDAEAWQDFLHLRDNPRGPHLEFWHHAQGCRAYVKVLRDTATHEVFACGLPANDLAGEAE